MQIAKRYQRGINSPDYWRCNCFPARGSRSARLNQTIEAVRRYSLLKRQVMTKTLSMHRLVQTVLRDQLPRKKQRLWAKRAIRAINTVFPDVKLETWMQCARYLPHVQMGAQFLNQYQLAFAKLTLEPANFR